MNGGKVSIKYQECNFRDKYLDEYTGEILPKPLIRNAIEDELNYFNEKVWRLATKEEMEQIPGYILVRSRWVFCNKGDADEPDERARLVSCEINREGRNDAFAASTPPLEAKKILFAKYATTRKMGKVPLRLSFVDIRKAYFNGIPERAIFMQVPKELGLPPGTVARQVRCVYGTRDAGKIWEDTYTQVLHNIGFVAGESNPCIFYHKVKDISVVVHGDDFTVSGPERSLEWLKDFLKARWDVKATTLRQESHQAKEVRVLNRSIGWAAQGIEYEADPRHRQVIIRELGLEGCTPVTTPFGPQEQGSLQDEGELLSGPEATKFRAIVARLNYLAADRPDIQWATKEVSKRMANPRKPDWQLLKRLGRYLAGSARAVQTLEWQQGPIGLSTYVDSDWAGDKKTCKSTSGGMIFRGAHLLKSWSTNQQIVALSSGEAELYAQTKGAAQTLGMISMGADLGEQLNGTVYSDSSAAVSYTHLRAHET